MRWDALQHVTIHAKGTVTQLVLVVVTGLARVLVTELALVVVILVAGNPNNN